MLPKFTEAVWLPVSWSEVLDRPTHQQRCLFTIFSIVLRDAITAEVVHWWAATKGTEQQLTATAHMRHGTDQRSTDQQYKFNTLTARKHCC